MQEEDGLEDVVAEDEEAGPVLAPEPSLAREESMGLNGVLAKGGDVPLEVPLAAGEDDEEQRADMQRVDSFKRKWPGEGPILSVCGRVRGEGGRGRAGRAADVGRRRR